MDNKFITMQWLHRFASLRAYLLKDQNEEASSSLAPRLENIVEGSVSSLAINEDSENSDDLSLGSEDSQAGAYSDWHLQTVFDMQQRYGKDFTYACTSSTPQNQRAVYFAPHPTRKGFTVVKYLPISESAEREIAYAKQFGKLNIAPVIFESEQVIGSDGTPFALRLVMDCGSSVYPALAQTPDTKRFALHLAGNLDVMEFHGIGHYDLKPGNTTFLAGSKRAPYRIIDFGTSRPHEEFEALLTSGGDIPFTPGYAAPEIFDPSYYDGPLGPDIFAYGMTLRSIRKRVTDPLRLRSVPENERAYRAQVLDIIGAGASPAEVELIGACIEFDAKNRPRNFGEIVRYVQTHL